MAITDDDAHPVGPQLQPSFTGRSTLAFAPDVEPAMMAAAVQSLGGSEFLERSLLFPELGVAVVPAAYEVVAPAFDGGKAGVIATARERISFVPPFRRMPSLASDAVRPLDVLGISEVSTLAAGIRVAVLDSGVRRDHPDFNNRVLWRKRFVADEPNDDVLGHGTHCLGIACGPATPKGTGRYGVASQAEVLVAKVAGWYTTVLDASLFAALRWARFGGAAVVNLSLGGTVGEGELHSSVFERVAERMLRRDRILLVAGAGNAPVGAVVPVNHPANCPSVLAVAALGADHARWSPGSAVQMNPGGEVNVAAPGTDILSTDIGPDYTTRSGTSMAAAFATGVAALWAGEGLRGKDLWDAILGSAIGIAGATREQVGCGIVQAP